MTSNSKSDNQKMIEINRANKSSALGNCPKEISFTAEIENFTVDFYAKMVFFLREKASGFFSDLQKQIDELEKQLPGGCIGSALVKAAKKLLAVIQRAIDFTMQVIQEVHSFVARIASNFIDFRKLDFAGSLAGAGVKPALSFDVSLFGVPFSGDFAVTLGPHWLRELAGHLIQLFFSKNNIQGSGNGKGGPTEEAMEKLKASAARLISKLGNAKVIETPEQPEKYIQCKGCGEEIYFTDYVYHMTNECKLYSFTKCDICKLHYIANSKHDCTDGKTITCPLCNVAVLMIEYIHHLQSCNQNNEKKGNNESGDKDKQQGDGEDKNIQFCNKCCEQIGKVAHKCPESVETCTYCKNKYKMNYKHAHLTTRCLEVPLQCELCEKKIDKLVEGQRKPPHVRLQFHQDNYCDCNMVPCEQCGVQVPAHKMHWHLENACFAQTVIPSYCFNCPVAECSRKLSPTLYSKQYDFNTNAQEYAEIASSNVIFSWENFKIKYKCSKCQEEVDSLPEHLMICLSAKCPKCNEQVSKDQVMPHLSRDLLQQRKDKMQILWCEYEN